MESKKIKKMNELNQLSYQVIPLDTWQKFTDFVEKRNGMPGYIFRGQNQSKWPLTPSINRENYKINTTHILHRYKMYTRGRTKIPFNSPDIEHWAIGQHHKLKTPLMDWTASPYVAAYFALREKRYVEVPGNLNKQMKEDFFARCKAISNDDCAVFCLNTQAVKSYLHKKITNDASAILEEYAEQKPLVNDDLKSIAADTDDPTEYFRQVRKYFSSPEHYKEGGIAICNNTALSFDAAKSFFQCFPLEIFSPEHGTDRLLNQRGLFVYWKAVEAMDDWVQKLKFKQNILMKITFPVNIAINALEYLNAMNINRLSLFPDLDGAGEYCYERLFKKDKTMI